MIWERGADFERFSSFEEISEWEGFATQDVAGAIAGAKLPTRTENSRGFVSQKRICEDEIADGGADLALDFFFEPYRCLLFFKIEDLVGG